jgi:hypothetical protein
VILCTDCIFSHSQIVQKEVFFVWRSLNFEELVEISKEGRTEEQNIML